MVKTLFKNVTIITEDVLSEFIKETYKRYNKKIRFMALLGIFLPSIVLIFLGRFFPITIFTAAFGVFLFFKGYILHEKKVIKNFFDLHGPKPKATYIFTENKITSSIGKSEVSFDYEQISDFTETNNLFILIVKKQGLMIKKDQFSIGEEDEFKSFLETKHKSR